MPVEPLSRCLRDFSRGSLYRQQIYEMWRQLTIRPSFGCFIEMVLSLLFLGWRGDDPGGGLFHKCDGTHPILFSNDSFRRIWNGWSRFCDLLLGLGRFICSSGAAYDASRSNGTTVSSNCDSSSEMVIM